MNPGHGNEEHRTPNTGTRDTEHGNRGQGTDLRKIEDAMTLEEKIIKDKTCHFEIWKR